MTAARARLLALLVAAATAAGSVASCDPGVGDDAAAADVESAVAALVDAHAALEAYDAAVADAPADAHGAWVEADAAVDDAVSQVAEADGLSPQQRSAVVGFRRGVQVARDAYADVADAAAAGDEAAAARARASARQRLDALANLRDGLPPHER